MIPLLEEDLLVAAEALVDVGDFLFECVDLAGAFVEILLQPLDAALQLDDVGLDGRGGRVHALVEFGHDIARGGDPSQRLPMR